MTNSDINPDDFLRIFSFFDDSDVLLIVLDGKWKIKFLNKKACDFFGVTKQDLVGKNLLLETSILGGRELREAFYSKIKSEGSFKHELSASTKDGSVQTATFEFRFFKKEGTELIIGVGTLINLPTRDWLKFLELLIEERTEALRESENKYRELVELAKSIIFKWDAEGKVIWMNEYGLKFFGFTEEEIIGRSVYETIVPRVESTGRDLTTLVRDIVEKEEEYASNINENVKKDGTRVWIHWSNRPIKDSKGNLVAILSIGTDITDRIKMEKMQEYELNKSRALSKLYSLLVSPTIKIGDVEDAILAEAMEITESRCGFVGRVDPKTGELVSNKIVQSPECLLKEKKIKLSPDNKPKSLIEFALSNLKPFYTNSPKDHPAYKGEPEWHVKVERFLAAPMLVEGRVIGILALANSKRNYDDRDLETVSEMSRYYALALQRINYEEELIIRENLYKTLFENAPVPTLLIDENDTMSKINTAFEKLSGYTKGEVEGKKIWKEFVFPEDLKKMEAYRAERLAGRYAPQSYEFRFLDKNMNVHDVLINVSIIPGTKKTIASFIDLTDIKRLNEALKRSKEELEKYSKHLEELVEERTKELREKERLAAIGEAATSIAHDLKSPLQVLINSVYIAKMGISKLPAPMVEQLKSSGVLESLSKMEKQIGYINRILLDLQEISRPIKPEALNVNLGALIQESLQSVTVPNNIELKTQGELDARLDPYLMKRVLINLIENAVQAMPKGGKLEIACSRVGSELLITIKDTGIGMPKEVVENIFKPFFTTKTRGTGFGLYTSKRIVEAHGGTITVESEVGKGTTFTIRIPIKQ
ncbi:MAG: PAS domain S-box protein [Candidatus Methanomethyliales bacterium]|nr:PAS domain S-box protein [Candidatus Methanomethylicales archaeon]